MENQHLADRPTLGPHGRFAVERKLGAGAFGEVLLVYDRQRGHRVALKRLRRLEPTALYQFKHEFRALVDIGHPNLVPLYELFEEQGSWFFTMAYVDGHDLLSTALAVLDLPRAEPITTASSNDDARGTEAITLTLPIEDDVEGPYHHSLRRSSAGVERKPSWRPDVQWTRREDGSLADWAPIRGLFADLVQGVSALHRAGLVHRDLKPNNVLVESTTGRVRILDFGLVADGMAPGVGDLSLAGTPLYMSPEQARCAATTAASDWYSVGVMLFEVLTGHCPFDGPPVAVMGRKQFELAPDARTLNPDADPKLSELCADLLQLEPERRPDASSILVRLGMRAPGALADLRTEPIFVGRDQELATLETAFARSAQGPVLAIVEARSGLGKTYLVEKFLRNLAVDEPRVTILRSRCYVQEWVSFKVVDGLMDSLSGELSLLNTSEVDSLLPPQFGALARLFPVLGRVPAVRNALEGGSGASSAGPPRHLAATAFRELLLRMATRGPVVLFVDDLHWGDLDSATLIAEVLRNPDPPPLLLVATARVERDEAPFLDRLAELGESTGHTLARVTVPLTGLPPRASENLLHALLEVPLPERSIARYIEDAQGHPLLLRELAREMPASDDAVGASLLDLLWRRVCGLSFEARSLLACLAVAGRPISVDLAQRALDLRDDFDEALAILHKQQLIVWAGERIGVAHDRIREAIEAHENVDTLRVYHARWAAALEASALPEDVDAEALAYHLRAAGEPARAATFALRAGRRSLAAGAIANASAFLAQALDDGQWEEAEARALREELADVLCLRGRAADAVAHFLGLAHTRDEAEATRLRIRAAQAMMMTGRYQEGLKLLEDRLDRHGLGRPTWFALARDIPRLFYWLKTGRLPAGLLRDAVKENGTVAESSDSAMDLERLELQWALTLGATLYDTVAGVYFVIRHTLDAARSSSKLHRLRARCSLGLFAAVLGDPQQGDALLDAVERELESDVQLSLAVRPLLYESQGTAAASRMCFIEASSLLDAAIANDEGDRHASILAHAVALVVRDCLGRWRAIRDDAPRMLEDLRVRGDERTGLLVKMHVMGIVDVMRDDVRETEAGLQKLVAVAEERAGYPLTYFHFLFVLHVATPLLYAGRPDALWTWLERYERVVAKTGQFRNPLSKVQWFGIRARAAYALAAMRPHERTRWLREAEHATCVVACFEPTFARGYALGLQACGHAAHARLAEAARCFEESAEHFERCGAALNAVCARWQGLAVLASTEPSASSRLESARALLQTEGFARPEAFPPTLFPLPS